MKAIGSCALLLLCLAATSGLAAPAPGASADGVQAAAKGKVAIYVFAELSASRVPTLDEMQRAQALKDLKRYLGRKGRLVLVDDPQKAAVVVQLFSAVQLFKPNEDTTFDEYAWTVDVTAGKQITRITESRHGIAATTHKLAGRIDSWVRANVGKPAK